MSDYRAQANHRLYLARIVLGVWSEARAAQHVPAATLAQAFESGICEHLVAAYGWFLLEITRPEPAPAVPPRGCAELPPPAVGAVEPGEIREFRRLESDGWLGELLRERRGALLPSGGRHNLAAPAATEPAAMEVWADQLETLFDRMSDSLEEY